MAARRLQENYMRKFIIAGLFMLGTLGAQAEVVPFNVFLSSTNYPSHPDFYTIPADKIYIIEGVFLDAEGTPPASAECRVYWQADTQLGGAYMTITLADTWNGSGFYWLPKPFRLKATERLHLPNNSGYYSCGYYGLMIDEADLYAQTIPSELQSVETAGGQLLANVKYGSSRPRITTIESAVDINGFLTDATGVEVAGLNRDESTVAVDQNGDAMKFLRVRSVARN